MVSRKACRGKKDWKTKMINPAEEMMRKYSAVKVLRLKIRLLVKDKTNIIVQTENLRLGKKDINGHSIILVRPKRSTKAKTS